MTTPTTPTTRTVPELVALAVVPWSKFDDATIEAIATEAAHYGDAALYRRAIAALRRRNILRRSS